MRSGTRGFRSAGVDPGVDAAVHAGVFVRACVRARVFVAGIHPTVGPCIHGPRVWARRPAVHRAAVHGARKRNRLLRLAAFRCNAHELVAAIAILAAIRAGLTAIVDATEESEGRNQGEGGTHRGQGCHKRPP